MRPIEEFRHTPVIPFSEKELTDHREQVEFRNRKGYYVEIRKDTIYFYFIAMLALGFVSYIFLLVNEK